MRSSNPLAYVPDPEALVECPYNKSHRISQARLQFHLVKCRKNHPLAQKKPCLFNTTHIINEQEFDFHLEHCPNRGIVDTYKYRTPSLPVAQPVPTPVAPPSEENWDTEFCGTYDPSEKISKTPVIHGLIGGTKSERKQVKLEQRKKFQELDMYGTCDVKIRVPKAEAENLSSNKLRPPKTFPKTLHSESMCSLEEPSTSTLNGYKPLRPAKSHSICMMGVSGNASRLKDISNDLANLSMGKQSDASPSVDSDKFIVFKSKGRGKRDNN